MRIVILMSTYNGARHVQQQLTSILDQLQPDGRLLIRDDGSSDETVTTIRSIQDPRIHVTAGPNLGFALSFLTLLSHAPDDADMYMLADQDDVWLPEKINRAWQQLEPVRDQVALYCSRAQLTGPALNPLGLTPAHIPAPSLRNALLRNIATGCTVAITPALRRLASATSHPELIGFHDWWLYVIATAFGQVYFDSQPTLLYRQHNQNAIGMGGGLQRYLNIIQYLRRHNWLKIMNNQIWAIRHNYRHILSRTQLNEIEQLQTRAGHLNRRGIIFSTSALCSTLSADLMTRLLVLLDLRKTNEDIRGIQGTGSTHENQPRQP